MRWFFRKSMMLALTLGLGSPLFGLSVKTAVDDPDSFDCSGELLGQTASAAREGFKAFPLCLMRVSCTTTVAIRDANLPSRRRLSWVVPCKPTETGCPQDVDYKACVYASLAPGRDFGTSVAVVDPDPKEEHQKHVCTYSKNAKGQERVNYVLRKVGDVLDRVCVGEVSCNPALSETIAVCIPKQASTSPVVCPSASTCVSGRFPLEQTRTAIAA